MTTAAEVELLREHAVDALAEYLAGWSDLFAPGWPVERADVVQIIIQQLEAEPTSPWVQVACASLWEGWRLRHANDPLEAP